MDYHFSIEPAPEGSYYEGDTVRQGVMADERSVWDDLSRIGLGLVDQYFAEKDYEAVARAELDRLKNQHGYPGNTPPSGYLKTTGGVTLGMLLLLAAAVLVVILLV